MYPLKADILSNFERDQSRFSYDIVPARDINRRKKRSDSSSENIHLIRKRHIARTNKSSTSIDIPDYILKSEKEKTSFPASKHRSFKVYKNKINIDRFL